MNLHDNHISKFVGIHVNAAIWLGCFILIVRVSRSTVWHQTVYEFITLARVGGGVSVYLSVCYHKIAVNFNYLKI